MTTIVVPIKDAQGVVLGVVGIDIGLLNLQEDVTRIKTHKSGGAFLLGNDALFASYPHSNAIGQSFNSVSPALDQKYAITKTVAQGERLSFDDISPISGQPAFFVFNPVRIGSTTTPWSLALFVPVAEVMEPVRNNVMWLIIVGIIGIATTGAVVFWFAQSLSRPIEKGAEYAAVIAGGDLTQQIDERYCQRGDEVGTLVSALRQMQQQLTEVISQVQSIAAGVHSGADEIVAGNRDLSARTEAQAASLEQTAASMEQLTATVRHNVENAGMANRLADEAQTQAEQGKTVVSSVLAAMTAIDHSNSKINDIVEVIDTFAFQTNLLALNAAVEAARAGEQGRGFAIVAGEVRQLAQRSAAAAKEIRVLVADSAHKVHDGGQLAESAGAALQQIVSSVKKVGDIVAAMATASREQASGIEQINKAVLQLDQAVQQNATLVEEIASSGDAFNEQVANLRSVVDFFNVRPAAHIHPSS